MLTGGSIALYFAVRALSMYLQCTCQESTE